MPEILTVKHEYLE